jgi:plastocyanin
MPKTLISILIFLGALTVGPGSLLAQEPPPTPADLTLRPGDTITWSPNAPHLVRFGGTVTHKGAQVVLTPFSDVQKVLDISPPPLTVDAQGVALAGSGQKVTATVKTDAPTSGVAEFFFTCGFVPHTGLMVTVPFKIAASSGQPARNVQIVSVSAGTPRWVLKTPQGDKNLTRP